MLAQKHGFWDVFPNTEKHGALSLLPSIVYIISTLHQTLFVISLLTFGNDYNHAGYK